MPRLDGTGPLGKGPKTGRGLGKCSTTGDAKELDNKLPKRPLHLRGLGLRSKRRLNSKNRQG
jgi:hypothetical protein